MAEVLIDITAKDGASSVLRKVEDAAGAAAKSAMGIGVAFARAEETMTGGVAKVLEGISELEKRRLSLDVSPAMESLESVRVAVGQLGADKSLKLDVSQALSAAGEVATSIDAIPDISYKTVIVRYQTQASPIRPFSEGIAEIRKKMESLPTVGRYTLGVEKAGTGKGYSTNRVSFSPTINISSPVAASGACEGSGFARALDRELARMWRSGRSELKRAMTRI